MNEIYDLIIIGSGPAGMTAAIYGARAEMDLLLLEKNPISGGQIVNTYEVDNYPGLPGISGYDLGEKMSEHVDKLGAKRQEAVVESLELVGEVKTVHTDAGDFFAKAIVITSGSAPKKLGVSGEEELSGAGVSYCATCDGAFFRGKTVAVVGGGDVAVEDAIYLARGCKKVYVIHRRNELRAAKSLQSALLKLENVSMVWDSVVEVIAGDFMVGGLMVRNLKTNKLTEIPVDGVFIAVGTQPNCDFYKDANLITDRNGYVVASEEGLTNLPGVFVAGDIRSKRLRQVSTAVGDGANVITSVQDYLNSLM